MSLWSANISLAPSTINIYYLTNCPNIHTSVKKQIQKPLKDILLTHVSFLSTSEFQCSESMGWEREWRKQEWVEAERALFQKARNTNPGYGSLL